MTVDSKKTINRISVIFQSVVLASCLLFASCATPPGQIIGDTVCECLRKTGGDRAKIKVCMGKFQSEVKAELERQNLPEGTQNEEAARAMSIMRLCMRAVSGWDTLRQQPPMMPALPLPQSNTAPADTIK